MQSLTARAKPTKELEALLSQQLEKQSCSRVASPGVPARVKESHDAMVEQKSKSEAVRVVVRCRPLNTKERSEDRSTSLKIDQTAQQISLPGGSQTDATLSRLFTFDAVFGPECGQEDLFHSTAAPIVDAVLKGFNGTIFTYGQTGAGKTFTMEGDSISGPDRGIVPRCFEQIFDSIKNSQNQEFLVRVSFLELYNEELRDLLARNVKGKLQLREKSSGDVYIKGLHTFVVNSIEDISRVLQVCHPYYHNLLLQDHPPCKA